MNYRLTFFIFFGLSIALAVPFTGFWIITLVPVIAVFLLTVSNYRYGIAFVAIALHISATIFIPREIFGVQGFNPLNLLIFITGLSYMASKNRLPIPWSPPLFYAYLLPFMFATLVGSRSVHLIPSIFEVLEPLSFSSGFGYFRDLFIKPNFVVLGAMLLAIAVQTTKNPSIYIHTVTAGCGLLAIAVAGTFFIFGSSIESVSGSDSRGFLSVLGMHANEIGLLLNLGYSLLIFSLVDKRGAIRIITFVSLLIIAIAILLTFSRGALVAFAIVNLVFLIRRGQAKNLMMFSAIALVIGAIFLDPILDRMGTGMQDGDSAQLSAGRLDSIWIPLLDDFSIMWLFPHGPSSIMWSPPMLSNQILLVGHTHSAYLGLIYDYGLILGGVIAGFLIYLARQFFLFSKIDPDPYMRHIFEGAFVAMLVLAIQGISDDRFTPTVAQTPLWCAIGMLIGRGGLSKSRKNFATPVTHVSRIAV
jgi:hypothetical protein